MTGRIRAMSAVEARPLARSATLTEWLSFLAQILVAISFELGDDLGRGFFSQHGTVLGITNARRVVNFETAHSFWVEPSWQTIALQPHHLLTLTISTAATIHIVNGVYVLGHVFVTLGVALWVYFYRRKYFALLRNAIILVNAFALVVYETFPVAPPRLTTGLIFHHHAFSFQDTVFGTVSTGGRLLGTSVGYNEFSAMPSVHLAWALVAGFTVFTLARPLAIRLAGAAYPFLMLGAVVVTGNHYLLDALGAIVVVLIAMGTAVTLASWVKVAHCPAWVRQALLGQM